MSNKPISIRLPDHLHSKALEAAIKMDMPLADVLRQCVSLGLKDLALLGYDLESVLHLAVQKARNEVTQNTPPPGLESPPADSGGTASETEPYDPLLPSPDPRPTEPERD